MPKENHPSTDAFWDYFKNCLDDDYKEFMYHYDNKYSEKQWEQYINQRVALWSVIKDNRTLRKVVFDAAFALEWSMVRDAHFTRDRSVYDENVYYRKSIHVQGQDAAWIDCY